MIIIVGLYREQYSMHLVDIRDYLLVQYLMPEIVNLSKDYETPHLISIEV